MSTGDTPHEQILEQKPALGPEPMSAFCENFSVAMNVLSRRWMGQVFRVLLTGPHRFNEILDAIPGISDPLLTQRLRELEANKLLNRKVITSSPIRVEYHLTEAGRDLEDVFRGISVWAGKWQHLLMNQEELDQCKPGDKEEQA
jgi:DNA-binding HxlR family transcriptional regulator